MLQKGPEQVAGRNSTAQSILRRIRTFRYSCRTFHARRTCRCTRGARFHTKRRCSRGHTCSSHACRRHGPSMMHQGRAARYCIPCLPSHGRNHSSHPSLHTTRGRCSNSAGSSRRGSSLKGTGKSRGCNPRGQNSRSDKSPSTGRPTNLRRNRNRQVRPGDIGHGLSNSRRILAKRRIARWTSKRPARPSR